MPGTGFVSRVRTIDGLTQFTLTPSRRSSSACTVVMAATPAFAAA
jgi:hypothetical protein